MSDGIILWEAHRAGAGGYELPESCLAAFEYGWSLGGRPEADVNLTSDGVMVSLHDATLDRICRNLSTRRTSSRLFRQRRFFRHPRGVSLRRVLIE